MPRRLALWLVLAFILGPTSATAPAVLAVQATPAAGEATAGAALVDAVVWLQAQQRPDGAFPGFDGGPDPSVTADAVVALRAAEVTGIVAGDALPRAIAYLEGEAAEAVAGGPGPAAKLTLAAVAGGRDPRDFGGADLVAALTQPVPTGTPTALAGAYGDDLYDHLLVVLALVAAEEPVPAAAIDLIRQAQAANGGWAFDGVLEPEATDSNTTALAIQALAAALVASPAVERSQLADDPAIAAGLDALRSFQTADGGFVFQPADPPLPDANSTALAVQAILAVGQDPASAEWNDAAAALRAFANPDGGLRYVLADPAANLFATLQGIPALAGMPLPVARLCSMNVTPADGVTPNELARTTGCIGLVGGM